MCQGGRSPLPALCPQASGGEQVPEIGGAEGWQACPGEGVFESNKAWEQPNSTLILQGRGGAETGPWSSLAGGDRFGREAGWGGDTPEMGHAAVLAPWLGHGLDQGFAEPIGSLVQLCRVTTHKYCV